MNPDLELFSDKRLLSQAGLMAGKYRQTSAPRQFVSQIR